MRQPLDEFAGGGTSWDDRGMSGFGRGEGLLFKQQAKSSAFFHASMAGDAVLVEDGFDFGTEINFFFSPEKEESDQSNSDQEAKKKGKLIPVHFSG